MTSNNDDLSNRLRRGVDRGSAPELSPELVTGAPSRPAPRMVDPARTLRVAGSAGLAVAALAVAAVVVVPSLTPRAPLFTAAEASDARSFASEGAATSDLKIGMWVQYNYSAAPSLSTDGGSGQVYRLALDSADPQSRTAELAEALGVPGAPVESEWSDAAYPTWVVGAQDGTEKSLSFSAFGTGDWWFNDPAAASVYICDASVTPEQSAEFGCTLPADAPENLAPTDDEARALAQELFASTGFVTDAASIEIYADDWNTTATAHLSVDGERTALTWSASWSNTGDLSYAYGHSLRVESQGTFDTVSPTVAVDRLNDGRWFGSPGPDFQGGAVAFDTSVMREGGTEFMDAGDQGDGVDPAEPVVPDVSPVEPTAPGESEPVDPAPVDPDAPVTDVPEESLIPVEPLPEPEVVDVTVDNATATLVLLWDVDGNAWLVPGYAMQMDEGWWNAVVSLVEGVIELPEPMVIEPAVIESAVVG